MIHNSKDKITEKKRGRGNAAIAWELPQLPLKKKTFNFFLPTFSFITLILLRNDTLNLKVHLGYHNVFSTSQNYQIYTREKDVKWRRVRGKKKNETNEKLRSRKNRGK